ncbi:MAG: PEP-CTERM sorting domain-containing protein [Candidatus Scalindua sp.]|nr:PEP-CTERM sorting domain-containing protein [Candidatus Scalindua sp.]
MKIIKCLTVGLLLLVCMSKVSTAASILYDFTGANTGTHESLNLTVDGVAVNVTAWANLSAEDSPSSWFQVIGQNAGVYDGSTGLGVQLGDGFDHNSVDGQSGPADGIDHDEGLLFVFSNPINLKSVNFGQWGLKDDFNLTIDGVDIFQDNASDPFVASYTGTNFLIWADGNSDQFRIQELTVEPVPEPATIAILGIGLAGILGGTARRRLKKAKVS